MKISMEKSEEMDDSKTGGQISIPMFIGPNVQVRQKSRELFLSVSAPYCTSC